MRCLFAAATAFCHFLELCEGKYAVPQAKDTQKGKGCSGFGDNSASHKNIAGPGGVFGGALALLDGAFVKHSVEILLGGKVRAGVETRPGWAQ